MIKGETKLVDACREHDLKQSEVEAWMETFVVAGERGLKARREDEQAVHEREVRELRAKVMSVSVGDGRPTRPAGRAAPLTRHDPSGSPRGGRGCARPRGSRRRGSPSCCREATEAARARQQSYRERSLARHGLICAKCAREFERANVHLLTVHHKDGNHQNNPADGSNWENLCVDCHEAEHSRGLLGDYLTGRDE